MTTVKTRRASRLRSSFACLVHLASRMLSLEICPCNHVFFIGRKTCIEALFDTFSFLLSPPLFTRVSSLYIPVPVPI
ncbi:hypothetical protein F5X99DRAFT_87503 [Biscogniauxia marginata]|nr:hypothetical protein F5X99DRAFT_87503 [Biscogniauxia marginata]